ncbi:serine hydrolase [Quadrisphaera sp. INWT6]|uniref:serine hydrolase domain-containing protein n=1 Tax=Quadrisphaera sp. INWT6 TaxID=2596917 RepID=UPI0019D64409|nr:serine hydrolase [Quadrisphaera sp. INWT6]
MTDAARAARSGRPLPTSAPSAQGVDARGVLGLLDALEAHPLVDPHGLVLVRHGRAVAQGWWAPFTPEQPHLLYSLSKSFTSAALGLAVADGLLSLDDRLVDVLPELADAATGERARSLRLRDLAAMSSGHLAETWDRAVAADPGEPLRGFLGIEPEREPGTAFAYNQPCTHAVAAAVQRATGQTLLEHLRTRLLEPLGVAGLESTGWQQHPAGRDLGFSGLHATTDAVVKLGLLHLQRGEWQGEQLLPAAWVDEAVRPHVTTPHEAELDWRQGYGYQFWTQRHGYRGDGAYGQFCVVLPEHDAVLAITADTPDMQAVLDAVWTHLLPAMTAAPLDDDAALAADAELAERTARLAAPPAPGEAAPADPADWDGVLFTPTHLARAGDTAVRDVRAERRGEAWHLVLREPDGPDGAEGWVLDAPFTAGTWTTTEVPVSEGGAVVPVSLSGGWVGAAGAESLRVEVRFPPDPPPPGGLRRARGAERPRPLGHRTAARRVARRDAQPRPDHLTPEGWRTPMITTRRP